MRKIDKILPASYRSRVIALASQMLANSNSRLFDSAYPLSSGCLKCFYNTSIEFPNTLAFPILELSSEFEEIGCAEIRREVVEEIEAIASALQVLNIPLSFSERYIDKWNLLEWQDRAAPGKEEKMESGWRRYALAVYLWRWHAYPFRVRNGLIFAIWMDNYMVIRRYDIGSFIETITNGLSKQMAKHEGLRDRCYWWRVFGICTIVSLALYLFDAAHKAFFG